MSPSLVTERTARTRRPAPGQAPHATGGRRPTVPWLTVIPIAVLMSFSDTYWTTSLRGAFGAIERTQDPFGRWLRDSTVLTPTFVLAVLVALGLAMQLFGPVLRRGRPVAVTTLLVALTGTIAGVVALSASSGYDYVLESRQLQVMDAMRDRCATGDCLETQRRATLVLQERSVLMGAGLMLLTNLLVVGWVVAARGGRLRVSTPRPARTVERPRPDDLHVLLVTGLVGSAVIHAAVVPQHLSEWPAAGAFFVALASVELVLALWIWRRPRPLALLGAAAVSVGPLVLWLASRTIGLPLGPEPGTPEAIGLPDVAACILELCTLAVAALLGLGPVRWRAHRASVPHPRWFAILTVIAVTALGLSGSGIAGFDNINLSTVQMPTTSGPQR